MSDQARRELSAGQTQKKIFIFCEITLRKEVELQDANSTGLIMSFSENPYHSETNPFNINRI